jgi:2-phospho-L-lactate guanylyltransferase
MSLWAIVPVKPLRRGKSRLSSVLSEDERTFLNFTLLGKTLRTLTSVKEIDQTLVISRDPAALTLAREFGARTLQEDSTSELNLALQRATVVASMYAAQSVLIFPADLPLISPEAVQALIQRADKPPMIVIAPDRRMEGTNALLINPVGLINYRFGPNSFERHIEQARKYNVRIEVFEDISLGLDLDVPEDLDLLREMEAAQEHS